jgi:hypothetical protein
MGNCGSCHSHCCRESHPFLKDKRPCMS